MDYSDAAQQHPDVTIARNMLDEISALLSRDEPDKAAAGYQLFITRFENSSSSEIQGLVARAMLKRAQAMDVAGNTADEVAGYDSLIARFEGSHIPGVLEVIGYAKMNLKNSETVLQKLIRFFRK